MFDVSLIFNESTILHKPADFREIAIFENIIFLTKKVEFHKAIVISVFMTHMICRAKFKS